MALLDNPGGGFKDCLFSPRSLRPEKSNLTNLGIFFRWVGSTQPPTSKVCLHSKKTNISPTVWHFWVDDFPNFPFGGIWYSYGLVFPIMIFSSKIEVIRIACTTTTATNERKWYKKPWWEWMINKDMKNHTAYWYFKKNTGPSVLYTWIFYFLQAVAGRLENFGAATNGQSLWASWQNSGNWKKGTFGSKH